MSSPSAAEQRATDSLGIVAVILAAFVLLPVLMIFLIGLAPGMNAIWWLGIVLLPIMAFLGIVALVIGAVGIVRRVRRHRTPVLSIVGAGLGLLLVLPGVWVLFSTTL
ncbi:hypothetical protein [Microbacterium sp. 5K110]|jgi:uncharacterized membrane protein|uniref:hypothetical protein n=1 Tax=unclassified Microbacterium TaxID=2609290 RepID=UPI0010FEFE28|nr:hypothetical protein [Microbacterium sp. 5K110]TLF26833.1 hypothetical protein FE256_16370 [Microbacterium sp. 5K110]